MTKTCTCNRFQTSGDCYHIIKPRRPWDWKPPIWTPMEPHVELTSPIRGQRPPGDYANRVMRSSNDPEAAS